MIVTKPAQEEVAERSLRQAGCRTYLPRYRYEMRPHGIERKGRPMMRPLLQGYVFTHDWHGWPKMRIDGIVRVLRSPATGLAIMLGDADIDLIWRREREGIFDVIAPPGAGHRIDIKVGDYVQLDLLTGRITGVLDELSSDGSAKIRAMMFGREIAMTVNAAGLRASATV